MPSSLVNCFPVERVGLNARGPTYAVESTWNATFRLRQAFGGQARCVEITDGRNGARPPAPKLRRAFTLFEVLLSLAILGLLAGILIGGSGALLRDRPVAVRDVFWQAVEAARKNALQHEREVQLRFFDDREKGKGFEVVDGQSATAFPLLPEVAPTELKVDFLTTQKGGNVILVAGVIVETQTVPYVTFYPEGTCTPFRVQIVRAGGTEMLSIDPWTCAEMLTPPDPNAPAI